MAVTRQQAAQFLVLLYRYVADHTPSHPVLLPAALALRDAAQLYRRNDVQRAFDQGVATLQFLQRARVGSPDLPMP